MPPSIGLGLFICFFFFLHLVEHHCIASFFMLKIFGSFEFFFMPPSFVWAPLMIENFLLCPLVLLGHFQSLRFFLCLSHLPPVWGVILTKVISKIVIRQRGTANDIFQPRERIIKNGLSSFQTHALRIGRPCFHASMQSDFSLFIQIKLNFGVTSWFVFPGFLGFLGVWLPF